MRPRGSALETTVPEVLPNRTSTPTPAPPPSTTSERMDPPAEDDEYAAADENDLQAPLLIRIARHCCRQQHRQ
jgi:hypothetical protein